jgi:hypothetical protein
MLVRVVRDIMNTPIIAISVFVYSDIKNNTLPDTAIVKIN